MLVRPSWARGNSPIAAYNHRHIERNYNQLQLSLFIDGGRGQPNSSIPLFTTLAPRLQTWLPTSDLSTLWFQQSSLSEESPCSLLQFLQPKLSPGHSSFQGRWFHFVFLQASQSKNISSAKPLPLWDFSNCNLWKTIIHYPDKRSDLYHFLSQEFAFHRILDGLIMDFTDHEPLDRFIIIL